MMQVLDVGFGADDRIGNYRVEHELGPTGSGVLLQARHQVLPRRAIIKVVHAAFAGESPYLVQTLREACILEAISHPGVPIVYESGVLKDRRPWFAFEAIGGPTLDDLLVGPQPIGEAAGLLRDLADILDPAHRRGVIHRGLRADRVMVTGHRRYPLCIPDWSEAMAHDAGAREAIDERCEAGGGDRAGFAGGARANGPRGIDNTALPFGSAASPGKAGLVDDRVDMFALGVIGYRALTGLLPLVAVRDAAP